jgi:hypothetical protein
MQQLRPSPQQNVREEPAKPPPDQQSHAQSQSSDAHRPTERLASGEQRWSICSETEAHRPKESFFRFGSSCQLQSPEDKSPAAEDDGGEKHAASSPVTSPRVAVATQSPPYRAMNND